MKLASALEGLNQLHLIKYCAKGALYKLTYKNHLKVGLVVIWSRAIRNTFLLILPYQWNYSVIFRLKGFLHFGEEQVTVQRFI